MTFIITLVALIIERFFHWNHLRHWRWFSHYERWLNARLGSTPAVLILIALILPPVLVTGVVDIVLSGWAYDIFKLVFGILVLMYCLGPANLWVQVYGCIRAIRSDDPHIVIEQACAAFNTGPSDNPQLFHQHFVRAIFLAAYQRVFAVLFWFVILGPAGAVLYRLVALSTHTESALRHPAKTCQDLLDWVPVRLFTFIFALGGHYREVFLLWKKKFMRAPALNDDLLTECGIAALDVIKENQIAEKGNAEKEAVALLDRVFVISLVILAMGVLLM